MIFGTAIVRRTSALLGVSTIALMGALASSSANAQSAAAPAPAPTAAASGGDELDTIVVTARKVSENLQDVPVSVTAFTGAQLQQQNAVTVIDIAKFTPGFTATPAPSNPTALQFSIRGQVQNDNLATLEPSVGTYVDGVYVARAYGINADLVDISSVQILKGPQGTLFGRNTSAGAILIETNKPRLDEFSGNVRAGYGNYDDITGSVVLNAPLVKDVFGIRAALQYHHRDGYLKDSVTGQDYNNIGSFAGRVKALWQVSPDFSILGSAEVYRFKSNGPARQQRYVAGTALTYETLASTQFPVVAGIAPANVAAALRQATFPPASQIGAVNTDPDRVSLNDRPRTDVKTQTYSLTAQYDLSFGTLKAIGGYRKINSISNIDLDGSPYLLLQTTGRQSLHQWSGELQLTGKAFDNKLDYAAGVTYFTEGGVDRSSSNNAVGFSTFLAFVGALAPAVPAGTFLPNATTQYQGEIDNKSYGVYGQATYHLTDKLSLTGGLRYSSDKKGLLTRNGTSPFNNTAIYISCVLPTIATVANDNCAAGRKDTFKKLSYTAGADYKITDDILLYAKAGRGYRSGGENLRANGDPATFAPFKPEISDEQEIGIKSELFDRRVRVNIAGYHNTITGAQRSLLLGVPGSSALLTVLYNAQKQRTFGVEADVAAVITPDITLMFGGALTDPKYKKYTQPITFGSTVFVDHSGDAFAYVPKRTFNAAIDLHHEFSFGRVHARGDVSYSSKYFTAPDLFTYSGTTRTPNTAAAIASFTSPSAAIFGANVGVTLDNGIDLSVWGRNIGNNRAYINNLYIGSLGLTSGDRRAPAMYGATASFNF